MRRAVSAPLAFFVLALGCEGTPIVFTPVDEGALAPPPEVAPDPASPAAFDPHLDGFETVELRFAVERASGARCAIGLARGGAALGELDGSIAAGACTAPWDGTDARGALVPPGPVELTATVTRGSDVARATSAIEIVRLGIAEVRLDGGGRAALLYPRLDGLRYGYHEVGADEAPWRLGPDAAEPPGGTPLELADGTPRERPAPWADLESPPLDGASPDGVERDTFNLPTAWVAGSTPDVGVTFTTAHAGGVADPTTVEVRVVAPAGLSLLDPGLVTDGAVAALETVTTPVPAVGRYDVTHAWTFEARRGPSDPWLALPGRFETTHRLYGLVAQPVFEYPEVPNRAWVPVVDRVTGWVDGAAMDANGVSDRIVEGVFYELGLQYDREAGASHYTDYGGGFERATFELSRFHDLSDGTIINCSDAASIVSAYANMVGVDLRYHIITHEFLGGFELNYLAAIGFDFAPSPFTSGRTAFRYHAVVGPIDTRIYDATLAVDGDADPGSPPHERLLVQGLSEEEYLTRLSPEADRVRVFIDQKVRIR